MERITHRLQVLFEHLGSLLTGWIADQNWLDAVLGLVIIVVLTALRGPLGSIGDALMWAGWLPTVAVIALALYWLGTAPWIVVLVFLVLYNLVHVALRLWGFIVGFEAGKDVAAQLVRADLVRRSFKLHPAAILAVGVVVGAAVAGDGGLADAGIGWFLLCASAFVSGVLGGHGAWRPAAAATVVAVVALALYGVIS